MKKFLTVLLVIAVMFTFSFGSAFAVTDFDGKNYQAMQEGDYYATGTVSHGVAGASGITDAERDAYVADLEKAVKTLGDDATYLTKKYCGNHLTNVTNYVKEALEAAKVTTTSTGLDQIKKDLAAKVATAKTKDNLITDLQTQYNTATSTTGYSITLRLAEGTYLLPGYGYYKTTAANEVVKIDSQKIDTTVKLLDWMLDNGYETKSQIESTAAQAALEKAVVQVSKKTTVDNVYVASTEVSNLTPEFVAAYYEWQGYTTKLAQVAITDLDATIAVEKEMKTFEKKYLAAPNTEDAYGTVLKNKDGRDAKVKAAYDYYTSLNFDKEYDAIKDLKSTEYLANKDRIVKLAQAIVAYEDKYDKKTAYNLTAELTAIEDAGDDAFKKAELPFATFKAESVLTSQKADVEAYASAYDAYKAEFKDAIYKGFGATTAVTTEIKVATEAKILALKANLAKLAGNAEDADAKLQAYLNNATVKVTTKALGNNKIRVNARFDAETYKDIMSLCKSSYTITYKFYHKTEKATSFKGPKEKTRNYITYTKLSLKKGTKYKFQCGVVIKDKDGKVVAEKSYRASTTGSRICR